MKQKAWAIDNHCLVATHCEYEVVFKSHMPQGNVGVVIDISRSCEGVRDSCVVQDVNIYQLQVGVLPCQVTKLAHTNRIIKLSDKYACIPETVHSKPFHAYRHSCIARHGRSRDSGTGAIQNSNPSERRGTLQLVVFDVGVKHRQSRSSVS